MTLSRELDALLGGAESVCVLTGAGISAESGVATFRGADGLWAKLKPEELANFDAFMRNPELVWEWYSYRRQIVHDVQPNAGHRALVEMQSIVRDFTLVTQNVDNLHQRAGSTGVRELHGNIERSYCISCGKFETDIDVGKEKKAPRCRHCGGLLRPDVVWFGEMLPEEEFEAAESAARRCELMFSVGTSAVVYPAAGLPLIARNAGAYVVEVNMERTEISSRIDETLIGPSGTILPELVSIMHHRRQGAA
jgi:NAD-dependent deacetylase